MTRYDIKYITYIHSVNVQEAGIVFVPNISEDVEDAWLLSCAMAGL